MRGKETGLEFILLPLQGDHTECVFNKIEKGEYVNETKLQSINLSDCPPSNFVERSRTMQEIYRHFIDNHRCVTLKGVTGNLMC
jgi:hypothetical protein